MKASVLIITFNEAATIGNCLASLRSFDDVLILDSGSTDATVEIAASFGARVMTRPFDSFAGQRNYGLDHGRFRHDWVLHLDADEVATEAFVKRLAALEPPAGIDAYRVPSKMMFMGRWLRHAGMWPTYQVRLGHAQRLRFKQVGHGQRENLPPERVGLFDEAYLHFAFSHGLSNWFEKHVRYAQDEAQLESETRGDQPGGWGRLFHRSATERRRGLKAMAGTLPAPLRPLGRFLYVYILRRGFLDGRAGLVYALMLATYEGMIGVLVAERRMSPRATPTVSS